MARPLSPPPLLVARPQVDELFFCGFPKGRCKNKKKITFRGVHATNPLIELLMEYFPKKDPPVFEVQKSI